MWLLIPLNLFLIFCRNFLRVTLKASNKKNVSVIQIYFMYELEQVGHNESRFICLQRA